MKLQKVTRNEQVAGSIPIVGSNNFNKLQVVNNQVNFSITTFVQHLYNKTKKKRMLSRSPLVVLRFLSRLPLPVCPMTLTFYCPVDILFLPSVDGALPTPITNGSSHGLGKGVRVFIPT